MRRRVQRPFRVLTLLPVPQNSSTHYVGYVEDDETPEAIMKKFEALERVQQAQAGGGSGGGEGGGEAGPSAPTADAGLTEEQLLEVFKQTSVFTVKSALAGLEYMHGGGASCVCVRSTLSVHDAPRRPPAPRLRVSQTAAATMTSTAARRTGARRRWRPANARRVG